jgi:beta-lactam-binding protein with PASTA domain
MATIFRGHDTQLGRDVAVKVLRAEYGRDPAFVARFRQEAQSAAALSHPSVVNVFDYGMEAGDPFIVMELIDGGDLASVLTQRGALEPLAAARIAQQIYEALDTAHARGIVHRDIKPTNVLLTSGGRVKVADFGIARAFSEAQLTMPGTTLGSVHYFSPEQARGEMVTTASDVYSAGLVLFEMLTGQRAWTGDSAGAVAVARLAGDPPAPSSVKPGIPPILDLAVRRALARVPADRPSAGEMAALLGRYIADPAGSSALLASAPPAGPGTVPAATPGVAAPAATAPAGAGAPSQGRPGPAAPGVTYGRPQAYGPAGGAPGYGSPRRGVTARQMAYSEDEEEEDQSAGPWGWIAGILGILVLFAGGVLLFLLLGMRGTPSATPPGSATQISVPTFVGSLLNDAERLATEQGLVLTVGGYQVTAEAPEGSIIAQDPAPGSSVLPGSEVTVRVATQQVTIAVPDLRLRTEAEAFAILSQNDLVPGTRTESNDPDVPATLVVRTNPRSGVEVARGTTVDYVVSLGPMPTPSPTPTLLFSPTPSPSPSPTEIPTPPPTPTPTPPPTPTPTPPPTPTPAPTPEPTPVQVGNYAAGCAETLEQATGEIGAAGLTLGAVFSGSSSNFGQPDPATWLVAQQYPAPGSLVPPGTEVDLLVKSPADVCP